jgi:hypothetical protein
MTMAQLNDAQALADSITPEQRDAIIALTQPIVDVMRRIAAAYSAAFKPLVSALAEPPTDLELALRDIRRTGRRELVRARNDLDFHVEGIYTDLGLERPR